jgi:hypothetical protein
MANIMTSLRPHLQPTLDWIESHRAKVQARMDAKICDASHDELRKSLEGLTHGVQLLGGNPTANIAIAADVRHRLDQFIDS